MKELSQFNFDIHVVLFFNPGPAIGQGDIMTKILFGP